ncbi:hypothetical protein EV426DRAFT_364963 [Tirmania nivea]|nr:hypothetical protein EV426DRAFT_364963 [Tirmania nivea]
MSLRTLGLEKAQYFSSMVSLDNSSMACTSLGRLLLYYFKSWVPSLELVVETTRDTRTGEESQMCWIEYSGSKNGALSAPVPRRSRSHRSSKHIHGEVAVTRRARSASRGRVHGTGYAEASWVHGSEKKSSSAVSQYHVEVRSSKSRRGSISREGRSRGSIKDVDIEHVTVYEVKDRHRNKSRSRKSKKSKRSSKSKSRTKHRSRSRSTSRSRRSMSRISTSASMGTYSRIEYADPSTNCPMLTYHSEDVHIVHAEPPPELSYIPTTYHQPQPLILDAPLVTTTGPGEDYYVPGTPKRRYFIKAANPAPASAPAPAPAPAPASPVIVSTHHAAPVPGGSVLHCPAAMHGAIQNEAELRRQHIYSSDSSDAAIHHDHERRFATSGSAHGHGFAVSAKYHSSGSHRAKRHSYHGSSASSSSTDSSDDRHRRTVYIGTEHLRNHNSGHPGVRVRYGGEKEYVVDVGVGYKKDSGKRESSVPSSSGKGGLRSKLKSAAPFLTAAAAGVGRRGGGSSTSSKSTSSSSSTTSTSSSN